jgi:MoaA/NifB/PqqE/SkfB family radical SAM enzyme
MRANLTFMYTARILRVSLNKVTLRVFRLVQLQIPRKYTYFAFSDYISVTENGDLIPCFYNDLRATELMMLGNIRKKSLRKAWEEV